MHRRRNDEDDNPLGALGGSLLAPTPASEDNEDENDFPEPAPSRASVLAALAIADDETDLEKATYYVQRAIAESLLIATHLLAAHRTQQPSRDISTLLVAPAACRGSSAATGWIDPHNAARSFSRDAQGSRNIGERGRSCQLNDYAAVDDRGFPVTGTGNRAASVSALDRVCDGSEAATSARSPS
jgi:hypothetical protein